MVEEFKIKVTKKIPQKPIKRKMIGPKERKFSWGRPKRNTNFGSGMRREGINR